MQLSNIEISIIVSHTIRRMIKNFEPHERTSAIEALLKRTNKFLVIQQKKNFKTFMVATEFERRLWMNATDKYNKETKIFAIDFSSKLYEYYSRFFNKAGVSDKIMDKVAMQHKPTEVSSEESYDIECSDDDLLSSYVKLFEEFSGVGVKKSAFAGKKMIIKNNLILEGKKIADIFL